jgi:TonB family protein
VNPILQLEDTVAVVDKSAHDVPMLQVEWSSRWQEFVGSIKPALSRSHARLAGEAPFGLVPLRIMIPSYVLEAFVIFAALAIQVKIAELRPQAVPRISTHEVIYYSGDELPRTEDLGGAEAGKTGQAGGEEAYHRTQTIKIARGGSLVPRIVDAPNVKLPSSRDAVANLLAIQPNPGPPPAEGLRSARSAPNLAANIVAPAPNVIRDYTRNGVQLNAVIAPAPSVTPDRKLTAPTLDPALIAPAPSVARDHVLVAPALAPSVIPPAPSVARDRSLTAPSLNAQVVAPAPSVSGARTRTGVAMAANVIPPAPGAVSREITSAPMQMTNAAVVPPPVSAPENARSRNSGLSLPAPSVVAPPPSADLSHDMRHLAGGTVSDPARTVVPPPPSQSGSGSFMSSLIGKIFGPSEVVPPPPSAAPRGAQGGSAPSFENNVVPPPPSVASNAGGNPHGSRNGMGSSLGSNVVAPPPSVGVVGGSGNSSRWAAPSMGSPNVVPPPPSLPGAGGGSGSTPGGAGANGGTLLANNIVPPPPSVGGGSGTAGSGLGRKSEGLGAPTDVGAGLAPPKTGGSGSNAGAVISTQPGTKVGIPTSGGTGSLAESPTGGDKPGLGGSGGGTGIARGTGPGSGLTGAGSGTAKAGTGHGSDPAARGGISPANGPGGAGSAPSGTPPVRGVDISGGSSIVTLPSFGDDPAANDPKSAPHSALKQQQALNVTVVATATSGGAFEPYKNLLRGEKYTTYFETSLGTVVMEFSDNSAPGHSFRGALNAPAAIRSDLADGTPRGRMVVACTVDASGNLRNVRVLESGPATMTAKVIAALRSWKFQPAMRNDQPVEVTAILGFGINTDDRF